MKRKVPLLMKLGTNIRTLREEKGLSQEQLALASGLDRTYLGGVERGERNIATINLCKIAFSLGVSPSIFLEGDTYDEHI
ncbi:MAG: helix-turn-helix domain-containing protein [Caldilineaceae bacterium]|nr:helix-turn-helix domain-containing protein [Caldilineaceae bacterium]